jgi:hypothetical protein
VGEDLHGLLVLENGGARRAVLEQVLMGDAGGLAGFLGAGLGRMMDSLGRLLRMRD